MDTKTIINEATDRMKRTVGHLDEELLNIRAGKATTNDVAMHGSCGSVFQMTAVDGDYFAAKYLYISDQTIKGNSYNDDVISDTNNGITYTNNATVLRYVIGV